MPIMLRCLVRIQAVLLLAAAIEAFASEGLTLQRFNNTAFAGPGLTITIVARDCAAGTCGQVLFDPHHFEIWAQKVEETATAEAGKYGFEVAISPPLPYPSPEAYARLWVHDHMLYPKGHLPDEKGWHKGGAVAAAPASGS